MEPADVSKCRLRHAADEPVLRARALSLSRTGNIWSSPTAPTARRWRRRCPEPLTFDEPLVRCEFMRMESSTGFGRYSGAAQHIPVTLNGEARRLHTQHVSRRLRADLRRARAVGISAEARQAAIGGRARHAGRNARLRPGAASPAEPWATSTTRLTDEVALRMFERARLPAQDHSACRRHAADLRAGALLSAATSSCTAPGPARARSNCIRMRWRR